MSEEINRELIISTSESDIEIALVENKQLVEINRDVSNKNHMVGDVYLGRVKRIMPGLNAAFVDVGYEKDAFLHYLDLGPYIKSINSYVKQNTGNNNSNSNSNLNIQNLELSEEIVKTGKISEVLTSGQNILVQVAKEPISTKGPRISSEISFAGRYLVLVPFSDKISISQKIKSSEERTRLKRLLQSIRPKNFGIIIRTVAENKKVAELDADLNQLVQRWELAVAKLPTATAPQKIISELDRTSAILRDLLNESFNSIYVDDQTVYDDTRSYIMSIASSKVDIVKFYKGDEPIFEHFGINKQIKASFGKVVTIKSGVYLIIEHTEALHVIDVNSGHRSNSSSSQEANALDVNLEAASEIARQLRLRDMGGIIVIDFIDLHEGVNRRSLYNRLKDEMDKDRAKHTILPPSKFGLVQITRQRVRPAMTIEVLEKCPCCDGTGKVKPSILVVDEIENHISYLLREQNEKRLTLIVHPYLFSVKVDF
jgi:ribonuclease G